jgi:hypothetical protein
MAIRPGSKERQQKVGIPPKRRGQQVGFAGQPDHNREESTGTLASRGDLKEANKMFADKSSQQIGSNPAMARTNSPSAAAMNSGGHPGQSTGEIVFKRRVKTQSVKKQRSSKRT